MINQDSQIPERLCSGCKWGSAFSSVDGLCSRPGLPTNLITGHKAFPCTIARIYQPLCGPEGRYWSPNAPRQTNNNQEQSA